MNEHSGHRQRLYQRLEEGEVFEHEKLEILLFNALPRKNTNHLAHRLLAKFGNIHGVLSASVEEMKEVDGIGPSVAAYLHLIGVFCRSYYEENSEKLYEEPDLYERESFIEYVKKAYAKRKEESLDFYLLDKNGRIFAKRKFAGGEACVELEPDSFTNMLITEMPAGIIAVHNHPTSEPAPSKADDDMTVKCLLACGFHNILFCDHIVYGQGKAYSYYAEGKMSEISQKCSFEHFLK